MLDRRDARLALAERGPEHGVADVLGARPDVHRVGDVGTPEHNALIGARGPQRHEHFLAGMQPPTGGANRVLERALANHGADSCSTRNLRRDPARDDSAPCALNKARYRITSVS